MAWTYSGDPTDSPLDKVRSLIGDVDANYPLLSNEEIEAFIGTVSDLDLMESPAIDACHAIIAKFSKYSQGSLGDFSMSPADIIAHYTMLIQKLSTQGVTISAGGLATRHHHGGRRKPFFEGMLEDREY
jgi:hypothetical protein